MFSIKSEIPRTTAKHTDGWPLPYAQYLDLYRTGYSGALPAESFVRLQEFASWAFGYTFVTAFVYSQPNNPTVFPVLFSTDGDSSPTATLTQLSQANLESLNLGPALIRLTSTDVRMIPGTGNSLPAGIPAWSSGAGGNSYITSITPVVSPGGGASPTYNDIIVGYFAPLLTNNAAYPFADGTHFMIVNGARSGSATASAQWYHLTFDFGATGFNSLQLLSRDTGQIQLVSLASLGGTQYALDWNLTGGSGDLFRFATSAIATVVNTNYLDRAGNVVLLGSNVLGMAGGTYSVISSTNLGLPLPAWSTNATGTFGAMGSFSNVVMPGTAAGQRYFMIKTP